MGIRTQWFWATTTYIESIRPWGGTYSILQLCSKSILILNEQKPMGHPKKKQNIHYFQHHSLCWKFKRLLNGIYEASRSGKLFFQHVWPLEPGHLVKLFNAMWWWYAATPCAVYLFEWCRTSWFLRSRGGPNERFKCATSVVLVYSNRNLFCQAVLGCFGMILLWQIVLILWREILQLKRSSMSENVNLCTQQSGFMMYMLHKLHKTYILCL